LPVVSYGYETWSFIFKEKPRLRVFENRVLRIFVSKRDEVTGKWRKLHNQEVNDLYSPSNIIGVIKWRMRWAGHVETVRERRGVRRSFVGKT
jgi:hypothetical protein